MSGKYAKTILEAIHNLDEVIGLEIESIYKYVKGQHPECDISDVNIQLNKLMQQGHVTKNKRGQRYNLSKKYLEKLLKQAEKGAVDVIKKAPMSKSKNSTKKASKAQKKGTKAKQTK